jgi:hypothetical protein
MTEPSGAVAVKHLLTRLIIMQANKPKDGILTGSKTQTPEFIVRFEFRDN